VTQDGDEYCFKFETPVKNMEIRKVPLNKQVTHSGTLILIPAIVKLMFNFHLPNGQLPVQDVYCALYKI